MFFKLFSLAIYTSFIPNFEQTAVIILTSKRALSLCHKTRNNTGVSISTMWGKPWKAGENCEQKPTVDCMKQRSIQVISGKNLFLIPKNTGWFIGIPRKAWSFSRKSMLPDVHPKVSHNFQGNHPSQYQKPLDTSSSFSRSLPRSFCSNPKNKRKNRKKKTTPLKSVS